MAEKTLGPEFWIHGGGLDLVFPHHENERAQSQAVGRPFAKIWMHNGLLRFTGEKMSKSVGNVATIQEVIAEWGREAALLFLMTGHWRKPLEFSQEAMTAASVQVESLRNALRGETRVGRRLGRARRGARRRLQHACRARHLPPLGARGRARRAAPRACRLRPRRAGRQRSRRRPRSSSSPARGPRHGPPGTSPSRIACATRSPPPAGRCGTCRARRTASSSSRSRDAGARSTGATPSGRRCAAAGRCSSSGSRSARRRRWNGSAKGPAPRSSRSAISPRRPGAPIIRASSPGPRPYPYADPWELAAQDEAAPRVPRPGDRPAEPRRRHPLRGRRGRDRRDRPGPRGRPGDAGGLPLVRGDGRASAGGRRAEPRPLPGRDQARRSLVVRRHRGGAADDVAGRPDRAASRSSSGPRARASARSSARPVTPRSRFRSRRGSSRSTSASPPRCCCTRRGGSAAAREAAASRRG